jgi:hypothetical protein
MGHSDHAGLRLRQEVFADVQPSIATVKISLSHAAALSSLSSPRITILSASSGNCRCSALASSHGARIYTSCSSVVVRITGIAFGWIGSTTAFADVVRNP